MATDYFNGTLPDVPTIGEHGKEIYFSDIMSSLSEQFLQRIIFFSAILFIYALYNYYIISPIMIKNHVSGSIKYWIYDLSHIFALVSSLALLVFALIGYYHWRI